MTHSIHCELKRQTAKRSSTTRASGIACILNYAPHYRALIFRLMDEELGCDFYFGANLPGMDPIEKMDVHSLRGFNRESAVFRFVYSWQCGYPWFALHKYHTFIVTAEATLSNVLLMVACKLFGKRMFLWGHGLRDEKVKISRPLRWFYLNAAGWLLYGERGKQILSILGANPERLHVVYNSLDYDRQVEVRQTLTQSDIYRRHFGNDDPVLLFIGRLTPQKKLALILDAVAKLSLKGIRTNVVFIGSGSMEKQLKDLAGQRAISDRVWFFGACHREESLGELIYNASVCVSPGEVGLTAMHAMVYGCPVVTHDNFARQMPEFEAVIEGRTGCFFPYDDQHGFAEAIIKILALNREVVRNDCIRVIDEKYNPHRQIETIKKAVEIQA